MSKKLKWIIAILVFLIILLILLSKTGILGKKEGIQVSAEKVQKRTITEIVTASGQIYPEVEVKVSSDISGEIVDLPVNEGDTVKRGQILAKIYADIYASQRDQAAAIVSQSKAQEINAVNQLAGLKATMDQTSDAYRRQKTLLDQKVISQSEFEQAQQAYLSAKANYAAAQATINAQKANVQSSEASLIRAQTDVDRATIVSPMDGVISLMDVKKGERVVGTAQMTGTEMMRIADLGRIEVRVNVGENDISKVRLGDSANIQVDAYNQRTFKGIVTQIANPQPTENASTSTSTTATNYLVHIRLLPDSYKDLMVKGRPFPFRPSMSASADIQTKTNVNVLSVALNAVTTRDYSDLIKNDSTLKNQNNKQLNANDSLSEVVFVIGKDNKVKPVIVKTGIQDINYIEILNGIKEGDLVVTGPYDTVSKLLKSGDKVKVVDKSQLFQANTTSK
ncbi:efflux RND transporter periplasmic adaptor subunit [Arachidicoccus soli]|uniref:HlyD family efflux transporter periplasmic adaptor subunit n=1 Tax=Arachidicoccus soli TaxID=2341117 RepID=A0A386HNC8_9BACT|nr:efflux RND transporter periplasmic adaptor subunit [Arachidicoccus soli]AYD47139.1 HlyD family efflux transporter periplasmic adaptor subunit [Arachidicoccus soli]